MPTQNWINVGSANGLLHDALQPDEAITWTNVDLSSVKSSDNPLAAISQEIPEPSVTKIRLKIDCLKSHSNLPR